MIEGGGQSTALGAYAPRGLLVGEGGRSEPTVASAAGTAAVLFGDLCGFTRLTAELARTGRDGADALTHFLDRCFGPVVDQISACGGDVVAFSGDSVLAIFEERNASPQGAARIAVHCALDLMEKHRAHRASSGPFLPLRIGLGAGEVRRLELGGEGGRWVHLAVGEGVQQALGADALRLEDRVVLAPGIVGKLEHAPVGERIGAHLSVAGSAGSERALEMRCAHLDSRPTSILEAFVPEVVVRRLAAGLSQFVAEFRNVSSVFFAFDSALVDDVARIQDVVATAQRCLVRFDGYFHQLVQDDKGLTLVAAFGVPPQSHDDDPERAVEFASELMNLLGERGVRTHAAVTTGSVYCGDYGGITRRQYGVVGASMNRAAHLLAGAEFGAVVCDADTRRRASRRRHFIALPALRLKGEADAVQPWLAGSGWSANAPSAVPELVGRPALRRALTAYLARVSEGDDRPPLLVLEGEAGIGKTTVLSDLRRRAQAAGVEVVWSQGEALRARASYAAVRPLVRALLAAAESEVVSLPSGWRPGLLSAVLPEQFDPDPSIEALTPQTRLEQLIVLLRGWIARVSSARPLLWIVEDAQWIDSASQSVLGDLAGSLPRLGVVLAQRPYAAPAFRQTARELLTMEPLERSDTGRVLAARLGIAEVPEPLLEIIQRRAAGNPLFAEELAGVLVERGHVEIVDGQCRLRSPPREIEHVGAPPSLESLITSRVDRLEPAEQLTLKAASVLGRHFDLELLRRVRPDTDDRALAGQLERLLAAGFLDAPNGPGGLAFRHPLFQEITYGLLVHAQRQILHRRAAEALEQAQDGVRGGPLAQLALHWEQAGDPERALPLLTRAADQALEQYANEESIDLYERALQARKIVRETPAVDLELARIQRNVGAAHASLTRHLLARDHFRRAIRACGYAVPDGGSGTLVALARHLGHRARRRLTGHGAATLSGPERELALGAMYAMAGLAAVQLWLGNERAYAHLALQLSNVGDQLEPSAEASGGASSLGYLLGLTPFRRAAERDLHRALATASSLDDREVHVICAVMYGMFLTATGRPAAAIETLRPASDLGAGLDGGPWRHRSRFMLAEALLLSGEFAEARHRFDEAAELARHGEPHVVGFANALGALARLHLGDARGAIAVLLGDDGVESTRGNQSRLPLFASLGALAEVCVLSGLEPERGAAAAREAESLAGDWSETASYFAGCFGHAGLLEWWVDALERRRAGADAHVQRELRRFRRFARRYPAAWTRVWLFEGRRHAARGHRGAARRMLARAAARARRLGLRRELNEAETRLAALAG
jgi:class 3 adenylate cyclase/tetratricopeptide (TPR) repeat protein